MVLDVPRGRLHAYRRSISVTTALVEGLKLILRITVADTQHGGPNLQRAEEGRTDDDNSINLAPAMSGGSSEFRSASSRFRRATRACSRVRSSARIPSRFAIASTISQCWSAQIRKSSHRSLETYCRFKNALGEANGSEQACWIARRNIRLCDKSIKPE